MRILFINPNLRPGNPVRYLPVGIAYVMTVVKQAGYDFDLLDIGLHDHDDASVEAFLERERYDVVLTGSIVTHYKWMKWLTRAIRRTQPEATIVVGNSVAGSVPEVFLENSEADVAVIGEGEYTTLALLDCLKAGGGLHEVAGIAFRGGDGGVVRTARRPAAPIDSIPRIDWELFDVERYFEITDASAFGREEDGSKRWRTMPVATARGCVFSCTFCHIVYKHDAYRHRCTEDVVSEVDDLIERYGANYINFWDDLTFYKLSQAEKIVDGLLASKHRFSWSAAVRTDLFGNPKIPYAKRLEVARKFKEAGCVALGYSLESGNQQILEMMEKHIQADYFAEQVAILRDVGITSNTSVVFGYPIETRETMRETFSMCESVGVYPSVGFLLPLPDTGMYTYARKHGFIEDENAYLDSITERQDICINMTQMEDQEILDEIQRGCGRLNEKLELGLSEDSYVRTGGYRKHTKKQLESDGSPTRNENDTSFNYSNQVFDLGPGGS
ncbi:MAG: radical SAM protein [Myxococcota bacterium]|nr:radical SAM protein [Myxococcota bacterium]